MNPKKIRLEHIDIRNVDWYNKNISDLRANYKDKVLIIDQCSVVGVFDDYGEAIKAQLGNSVSKGSLCTDLKQDQLTMIPD